MGHVHCIAFVEAISYQMKLLSSPTVSSFVRKYIFIIDIFLHIYNLLLEEAVLSCTVKELQTEQILYTNNIYLFI